MTYTPRKCSATNRLVGAKDHASVQFNIGHLDSNGVYNKKYTTIVLAGYLRKTGEADAAVNRLAKKHNLL